jgi:hypothetical protein
VKALFIGISLAVALLTAATVKRDQLKSLENGFASSLKASQMRVLVYPSSVYIDGFGVVFTSDVNLSYSPMPDPFQQVIPPQAKARTQIMEQLQLPLLRNEMRQLLMRTSVTLDTLPVNEQIVVSVTISQQAWQDRNGMPQQIVMQGQKAKLMDASLKKLSPESVIRVQEQN